MHVLKLFFESITQTKIDFNWYFENEKISLFFLAAHRWQHLFWAHQPLNRLHHHCMMAWLSNHFIIPGSIKHIETNTNTDKKKCFDSPEDVYQACIIHKNTADCYDEPYSIFFMHHFLPHRQLMVLKPSQNTWNYHNKLNVTFFKDYISHQIKPLLLPLKRPSHVFPCLHACLCFSHHFRAIFIVSKEIFMSWYPLTTTASSPTLPENGLCFYSMMLYPAMGILFCFIWRFHTCCLGRFYPREMPQD